MYGMMEAQKLNEYELENVTGGSYSETANDSRFLNSLNGSCNRYGATRIAFTPGSKLEDSIQKAWTTVGIRMVWHSTGDNEYFLNGNKISQSEARKHGMQVTGHWMDVSDWDW